jgi:hypothetical protein
MRKPLKVIPNCMQPPMTARPSARCSWRQRGVCGESVCERVCVWCVCDDVR